MSYSINVKSTPDGVQLDYVSGTVPEGTFIITGHEDSSYRSLSASQYSPALDGGGLGDMLANAAIYVRHPASEVTGDASE